MSREDILQTLPNKKWYWSWETQNRNIPSTFIVTDDGQIFRVVRSAPRKKWKLELRWVLDEGGHLFIPVDDHTLRGFYIPTGRQVELSSYPTPR